MGHPNPVVDGFARFPMGHLMGHAMGHLVPHLMGHRERHLVPP
jgi:hypothetical protein